MISGLKGNSRLAKARTKADTSSSEQNQRSIAPSELLQWANAQGANFSGITIAESDLHGWGLFIT